MMRNLISKGLRRILSFKSISSMAFTTALGVFIGMLPLIGVRIPILILIVLIFGLNIIALTIGILLTIIFPFVHILTMFIYQSLGKYDVPFFTLRFLYVPNSIYFTHIQKLTIISSVISAFIFSLFSYPIFKLVYKTYVKRYRNINYVGKRNIFLDKSGKRLSVLKIFTRVFIIVSLICIVMFGFSVSMNPFLPDLGIKNMAKLYDISSTIGKIGKFGKSENNNKSKHRKKITSSGVNKVKNVNKKVLAFYVGWDDNSFKSLKNNYTDINMVVPDWFTFDSKLNIRSNIQPEVDNFVRDKGIENIPLINNYVNNTWDSNIVNNLINVKNRENVIDRITEQLKSHKYSGLNLDIENIDEKDKKDYVLFVKELYESLNKNKLKLIVDLPAADETLDYKSICKYCDYVVLMSYDEHYEGSEPGAIASLSWSQDVINNGDIPSEKLLGGIGDYGYDWTIGEKTPADSITFTDVLEDVGLGNISIKWDKESKNPYFSYKKDGKDHIVWFLDGSAFYNQSKAILDRGAAGIAIWRLGGEDSTIWNVVKNINNLQDSIESIENIYCSSDVHYSGSGEVLYIESGGNNGKRNITLDNKGYINDVTYSSLPSIFNINRFGKADSKTIALTFDDGPDPYYTPKILDILKKYDVKGSFFIVGENATVSPDIVARIYNEGHDIGNHTFTHPNISQVSSVRTKMELNATQRLIEEITGHSTILFRPPYVADAEPSKPEELIPIIRAQELGYIMVGELIDPLDWQAPKEDELYNRIISQIKDGNIILLHDCGGNRDSTLKVLPRVIEKLKGEGYKFVTVSQLMGKSRDEVMPSLKTNDNQFIVFDKMLFDTFYGWSNIVKYLFYTAGILGIIRLIILLYLSLKHKKFAEKKQYKNSYKAGVTVIIAAYNEEKVICKTINSVLASNYDNLEIIVIDDGSTDGTLEVLRSNYSNNPLVNILSKENGGKTSALNLGFIKAKNEVIVTIDADTVLEKDAISLLARHFFNPEVVAVSGNIKVGNVNNLLTAWQHMEYVTGFNLEKRSYSLLNCITVVPGAIGAWRKSEVLENGLFSEDTLAEDTDMTLKLVKKGGKILLEQGAKAYTEAPEDLKSLIKQRYRWTFGTLQCIWKHRDAVWNSKAKALGFFAMPNMILFQYVFLTLSPVADIYCILGLFSNSSNKMIVFYVIFFLVDLISALYAFSLEKENKRYLLLLIPQRIFYRMIMVYVAIKSLMAALLGRIVGWNKLTRLGTVIK